MTHEADLNQNFYKEYAHSSLDLNSDEAQFEPQYVVFKFLCDKGFALLNLPIILLVSVVLLILNPFFNPGPLFFTQDRMGKGQVRFKMWKFRTMSVASGDKRSHDDPVETHRITPFAHALRKFRIDELPNFLNVLGGSMSLVGPRPDVWDYSTHYVRDIMYYNNRFQVRPGITGLAQIRGGYADSVTAIKRKARFDWFYVKNSRISLDLYIIWSTLYVICTGFGAK